MCGTPITDCINTRDTISASLDLKPEGETRKKDFKREREVTDRERKLLDQTDNK